MTNHMAVKVIKSLREKKYRETTKKFLVEGEKSVLELIESNFKVEILYVTAQFQKAHKDLIGSKDIRFQLVDPEELNAIGTLEHNNGALAIAFQKVPVAPKTESGITLVLDDIRDPGNLGTLIRIADWYGIRNIVCSVNCVDWYNPKVVSASMGSFSRVTGFYTDLPSFLAKQKVSILGGFLDGVSSHEYAFPSNGILVIGSESHGISREVAKKIKERITIPRFGKAESLNAAVAGAIILDRWKAGEVK